MSDNKCKPTDSGTTNKCSTSHFESPSEPSIPPHAPNRRKSSSGSIKEKAGHDSQQSKTVSKSMSSASQPRTPKESPTEAADKKEQSMPVSSGANHDDNADKASQSLPTSFTEKQHEDTVIQTSQSNTPTSAF